MGLFRLEEDIVFAVKDLGSASAWYREKLECKTRPKTDEDAGDWDDVEAGVVCTPGSRMDGSFYLVKLISGSPISYADSVPRFVYCKNLNKALEFFSSRSVLTGAIQEDRDGARFFEIHDLDGNKMQILES